LPLSDVISCCKPIFSTSGVGSTPGNSTKNTGVSAVVSSYVDSILNGSCITYSSPMLLVTNIVKADVILSGLNARKNINLLNSLTSL